MCRGCVGTMHCLAAEEHTGPPQHPLLRGWRAGSKHSLLTAVRTSGGQWHKVRTCAFHCSGKRAAAREAACTCRSTAIFWRLQSLRSLVSFFKELPVVLNKLKPWLSEVTDNADKAESVLRLREWQETLVSLTHLANKYKVGSRDHSCPALLHECYSPLRH